MDRIEKLLCDFDRGPFWTGASDLPIFVFLGICKRNGQQADGQQCNYFDGEECVFHGGFCRVFSLSVPVIGKVGGGPTGVGPVEPIINWSRYPWTVSNILRTRR